MRARLGFFAALALLMTHAPLIWAQPATNLAGELATQAREVSHRPLRSNQAPEVPLAPTEPVTFRGYPDAPSFEVTPRQPELTFYPCAQCHQHMPPNPEPRKLVAAPHPAALDHGSGRMWCVDCHSLTDRNNLRTIQDTPVNFNESDRLCGQCHADRHKDWVFGGHGKRVAGWGADRTIYACTHCHNPHSPSLKPRAPSSPPPVRAGLKPMPTIEHHNAELWQRYLPTSPAMASEEPGEAEGEHQ